MATVSLLWASSSFRCTYWRGRPIPYTKCLVFSLERVSIRHTWSNESYSGSWPVRDGMSSRFPWLVWYTLRGPSKKGREIYTKYWLTSKQTYLALCLNDHFLDQRLVTPQIQVVYVTQSHPRVTLENGEYIQNNYHLQGQTWRVIDLQRLEQLLPMSILESIRLELRNERVRL